MVNSVCVFHIGGRTQFLKPVSWTPPRVGISSKLASKLDVGLEPGPSDVACRHLNQRLDRMAKHLPQTSLPDEETEAQN